MKVRPKRKRPPLLAVAFISLALLLLLYSLAFANSNPSSSYNQVKLLEIPGGRMAMANQSFSTRKKRLARFQCIDDKNIRWEMNAAPTFIIAGVQKGGTSALRGILVQHPKMIASTKFEPHFFDSKLQRYLQQKYGTTEIQKDWLCDVRRHYIQSTFPQAVLGEEHIDFFFEKTPSYLVDPDVPALIHSICSWKPKILVMLRNPIERAYSHYKMEREKLRVKEDFETVIRKEIAYMQQVGISSAPLLSASGVQQFADQLDPNQFQLPPSCAGVDIDRAHKQVMTNFTNTNFLQRGMYARQLQRWIQYFPLGESLLVLKFEDLQADPASIYQQILDFLGAPSYDLQPEDFVKAYKTRGQYRRKGMVHPPMSNDTRRYLEQFFMPYNELLTPLLGNEYYSL